MMASYALRMSAFRFVIRLRQLPKPMIVCRKVLREEQMAKVFSPSNSALVLIDHQYGTMQLIKNLPARTGQAQHAGARSHGADPKDSGSDHQQPGGQAAGRDTSRAKGVSAGSIRCAGPTCGSGQRLGRSCLQVGRRESGPTQPDHGRRNHRRVPGVSGNHRDGNGLSGAGGDGRLGIAVRAFGGCWRNSACAMPAWC